MRRYHQTRFSSPGKRGTVKPYETEKGKTTYYLSAVKRWEAIKLGTVGYFLTPTWKPRVFWLHPTKGWRSQGARS